MAGARAIGTEGVEPVERAFECRLLRGVNERGRRDLRAAARLCRLAAGEALFDVGATADSLYVVAEGSVELGGRVERAPSRRVLLGELFGEDAFSPASTRLERATAGEPALVVELPLGVVRRALERSGLPELLAQEEQAARRAFAFELARGTVLGRLSPRELGSLVERVREERFQRGAELCRRGEPAHAAFLVARGLVALERAVGTPLYAARGDLIGFGDVLGARGVGEPTHGATARAEGDVLVLLFPPELVLELRERHAALAGEIERVTRARHDRQERRLTLVAPAVTRRAPDELERLLSARSLLAIDLERCVRCGHCAKSCADAHGSPRLERRGEKVVLGLAREMEAGARALFFPGACQHCREPACLGECPTGAIRRDALGIVQIAEDLCTGCEACAKACPYGAVRMQPRRAARPGASELVADKCDLCHGRAAAECVSACPTDAIFRLDPSRDVLEARSVLATAERPRPSAPAAPGSRGAGTWIPWLAAAAALPPLIALSRLARDNDAARLSAGILGALLVVLLSVHALVKRSSRLRSRTARLFSKSKRGLAFAVHAHTGLGLLALFAVLVHAGFTVPRGALGALASSFWAVAGSGLCGAFFYRFVPARLARLERRSLLPEDFSGEREAFWDRLHRETSGENPVRKALVKRLIAPYARAPLGFVPLIVTGRSLAAEEARLRTSIERALAGHRSTRLEGVDRLIKAAVELRALTARRILTGVLRAWLVLHLLGSALLMALLALHVLGALL